MKKTSTTFSVDADVMHKKCHIFGAF
jgi:hypothetical protein